VAWSADTTERNGIQALVPVVVVVVAATIMLVQRSEIVVAEGAANVRTAVLVGQPEGKDTVVTVARSADTMERKGIQILLPLFDGWALGGPHGSLAFFQLSGGPSVILGHGGKMSVLEVTCPSGRVTGMTVGPMSMLGVAKKVQPSPTPFVTFIFDMGI